MAELVCAVGVPHTPSAPALVAREGPGCETARLFRAVREQLAATQPDVVVIFDSDHLNTFFFDNLPTFAVGAAPKIEGPNDDNATGLPGTIVPSREDLGLRLHKSGVESGYDLALTQRFTVDHSIMVPLHFLTPAFDVPAVPVFINGIAPPLPAAKRCFALGELVRATIEAWPQDLRVGVVASGSFSLEVAGPKMRAGSQRNGVPDPGWVTRVTTLLNEAKIETLLEEATTEQLGRAGNVAGEILNWIAMLGVLGKRKPAFAEPQLDHGHAYAAWRWD